MKENGLEALPVLCKNLIFEKERIANDWGRKGLISKCCWNNLEHLGLTPSPRSGIMRDRCG